MALPPEDEVETHVQDEFETDIQEGDEREEDREGTEDREGEGQADHQEQDDDGFDSGEVEQPRRRGRAADRIHSLTERVERAEREAREAREALERRALERDSITHQAEQRRLREERLALMEPHERTEFLLSERIEGLQAQIRNEQMRAEDRADRAEFSAMCATDKALASVRDEVEAELAKLRAAGSNIQRETLANFLIGKRARDRAKAATTKAGRAGKERIARQQGRPTNSRGESTSEGRRGQTARDRLEGKTF